MTEWLLRVFGLMVIFFAVSNLAFHWYADRSRWTLLMLLLTESYTLTLVLIARRASRRDTSPLSMVATAYAVLFYALFDTGHTVAFIPELAGVAFQVVGTAFQVTSKAFLGRSFGLLPAGRGLVTSGPYRLVRHPIYLGYLIGHVGFLLVNFSWRNFAVLAVLYAAQVWRMRREEAVLAASNSDYQAYRSRVRFRVVPFVY